MKDPIGYYHTELRLISIYPIYKKKSYLFFKLPQYAVTLSGSTTDPFSSLEDVIAMVCQTWSLVKQLLY
jgi:hypothetical protein